MKKAIVFLANGFEEMEALGTVDILRRGGIEVTTVSITTDPIVIGAHNVPVTADTTLNNALLNDADALILPGGMPGASNLKRFGGRQRSIARTIPRRPYRSCNLCRSYGIGRTRLVKGPQGDLLSGF